MKRKNIKRVFFLSTVFLVLLNIFPLVSFAGVDGTSLTSGSYMPVCPAYYSAENLPFGDCTEVMYIHYDLSNISRWFFIDNGENLTWSDNTPNNTNQVSFPFTGYFIDDLKGDGTTLSYWRLVFYSVSPIVLVELNNSTGTYTVSRLGSIDIQQQGDPDGMKYYRYKYLGTGQSKNNDDMTVICSRSYYYAGRDLHYFIDANLNWGSTSNYRSYYIGSYPDSIYHAVQTIEGNQAVLEQYYDSLDRQIGDLQSALTRVENGISDLSDDVNDLSGELVTGQAELQSQLSSAQSEIQSNANAAASNAASEINNAGEDISDIENDVSDVNGIVSKCSEWVSDLDVFADRIDEAESGVAQALENGKTLVNGFLGVAPPIVIALLTFCLCWFVVRKVIGR